MSFRIRGLDPGIFRHLYGRCDAELADCGVVRMAVTEKPGFPCRVELKDAELGETMLLVNHEHLPTSNPYRSRHAIFVREGADTAADYVDDVPQKLVERLLSVRAFDRDDMMIDADVFDGSALAARIGRFFADDAVAYLHVHNARRGCFAARVDRA